ncbi:hypothetical protein MLD38_017381 [Melastoma candidum]|uniref:Uncharacterized protein n=1 Tax=Melastoma candidum TaxID=119954 RepID=A0ACB9QRL1_9MYRT|nr:hypothetical protein MLD38_017381 [Melastoma candidum]
MTNLPSFRRLCSVAFVLSSFSFFMFLFWCRCTGPCLRRGPFTGAVDEKRSLDLLTYAPAWNNLSFPPWRSPKLLKIAVFVKKWPHRSRAGGLERHALTLHLALAKKGHQLHVFTSSPQNESFPRYPFRNLYFHLSNPTGSGYLDQAVVWKQFQAQNSTGKPFDVIHTESVGLMHTRSKGIPNIVVSWHGIAYETIHSDIIQELLRSPGEPRSSSLDDRVMRVVEEVKFFPSYAHHVATSDHVGDVLKRVYMIPEERVHVILNGVDEDIFKPNLVSGIDFKRRLGITDSWAMVIGLAGRLVKDKGYPIMFEALTQVFNESERFRETVLIIVAGDGPWGRRYRDLGSNVIVLGPLEQERLASFYNSINVFFNPTLRAQGLDHTLLEAMISGKPVVATKLASITGSIIVNDDYGYTFTATVDSLKRALYHVWNEGRTVLEKKGQAARKRALRLFSATKMADAYERLFLCISNDARSGEDYCKYQDLSP